VPHNDCEVGHTKLGTSAAKTDGSACPAMVPEKYADGLNTTYYQNAASKKCELRKSKLSG
jgi:hypothetical protein